MVKNVGYISASGTEALTEISGSLERISTALSSIEHQLIQDAVSKPFLSNSDYVAIASGVIALCALGLSFWQGWLARENYRLSVKPQLEVLIDWVDCKISIANNGVGPAIIKDFIFVLNGVDYNLFDCASKKSMITDFSHALNVAIGEIATMSFFGEFSIAANGCLDIVNFPRIERNSVVEPKIKINVKYESIYGVKYNINS